MVIYGGVEYSPTFFNILGDFWGLDLGTGQWSSLNSTGPGARTGAALWNDGDNKKTVYLFGGLGSDFQARNDLWKYSVKDNVWTQIYANGASGNPPVRSQAHIGFSDLLNSVFMFSGDPNFNTAPLFDLWEFSLDDESWTNISLTGVAIERVGGAFAVKKKMIVSAFGDRENTTGGCTNTFAETNNPVSTTHVIDKVTITNPAWAPISISGGPLPLKNVMYTSGEDKLYVVGGYQWTNGSSSCLAAYNSEIYKLNLDSL